MSKSGFQSKREIHSSKREQSRMKKYIEGFKQLKPSQDKGKGGDRQ